MEAILTEERNHAEPIRVSDGVNKLPESENRFWTWIRPSLAENRMRGVIGEYWVANSLGILESPRRGWEPWDLETEDGIRVEVKSAGYIQSWHEPGQRHSTPFFGINRVNVEADREKGLPAGRYRPAMVYVFCLHFWIESATLDPLDISQWEFYVLPVSVLEAERPDGKTIGLSALKQLGAELVTYDELGSKIRTCADD